jgi:large subunit ribosomal protein L15
MKGFTNPNRIAYAVVNVETLARVFAADSGSSEVDPKTLLDHGLVRKGRPVKVLGRGELDRALTVRAHAFSGTARAKIEQAGGTAELIG